MRQVSAMQQTLDQKLRQRVQQFVQIVMDGHSYTEAWHRVTQKTTWGQATLHVLCGMCVEAANKAVSLPSSPDKT